jgi:K(+)-stimulated pyrophosphate-energized sodium pump
VICGLAAVAYGVFTARQVLSASPGNAVMQSIAAAIQEGAGAYLKRQYTAIGIVGAITAVIVAVFLGPVPAVAFVVGAVLSGVTGFIGMNISVRANVRTAEAARTSLQGGLTMAFRAGAITGMLVAGLALLAIAGVYFYLTRMAGLDLGIAGDKREIVDVSGAGDTVIAVATLALASNWNLSDIAEIANLAGGLVCGPCRSRAAGHRLARQRPRGVLRRRGDRAT